MLRGIKIIISTKSNMMGTMRRCRAQITYAAFVHKREIHPKKWAHCASENYISVNNKRMFSSVAHCRAEAVSVHVPSFVHVKSIRTVDGEYVLAGSPVESTDANLLSANAQELENIPDAVMNLSAAPTSIDEQIVTIPEATPALESAEKVSSTWDFLWSSDIVWPNVQAAQELLGYVHETTGLPWWMTLFVVTFTTRTCILPFAAYQQQVGGRLQRALPQLQQVEQEFLVASNVYKDPGANTRRKNQKAEIYATHNCHPWKLFAFALVQAPLFVSYFFAVKGLGDRFESFTTGGLLWFTDLTVQDPCFLLPVAAGLSMMGMLEVNVRARRFTMPEKQYKIMSGVQRIMCFSMIPLLAGMKYPAGVFVYWISNNLFSILQVSLFNHPTVRQWLGLPPLKNTPSALPFDPFLSKPK